MFRQFRPLAAALLLVTAASCANTKLVSSWKDPGTGQLTFKKVLVLVLSKDPSVRRAAEDTLVSEIKRTTAVASYTILPSEDYGAQEAAAKEKIKEMGFDGAIVMRMVDKSQQTNWVPGSYPMAYGSFYGYWGYGYGVAYSPGYMVTDTIVKIETNIYSVQNDKLLWSGLSETFNPTGPKDTITGIVSAVGAELKKQGMIQ